MNIKLSDLTLPGKLLLVLTVGIIFAASYWGTPIVKEWLPQDDFGKLMAVVMLVVGLVPGGLFFLVSAGVMRLCGLRVIKPPPPPDSRPLWQVNGVEQRTGLEVSRRFHAVDSEQAAAIAEMDGLIVRMVQPAQATE